jgi:hypothetical protein
MKRLALLLCLLIASAAIAGDPPDVAAGKSGTPPPQRVAKQPPEPRIGSLVLPQVNFREADFAGALEYFRRKAEQQSGGALKLTFVRDLPEDFVPQRELSLNLKNVPFMVALNYLGELAGVQFAIDGTTITAKAGSAAPPKYAPLPQDAPSTVKGSGALLIPAAPSSAGNNTYRKTDGTIQPDKSGYVAHRSMGGWSTKQDPNNVKSVNCSRSTPCAPCKCVCACSSAGKARPSK